MHAKNFLHQPQRVCPPFEPTAANQPTWPVWAKCSALEKGRCEWKEQSALNRLISRNR
jgi:hypothetical protein